MPVLKRIIFGNQVFDSEATGDKFLLTGYFLLMYIGIDTIFLFVNLVNVESHSTPIFTGLAISISCLLLLRKGWRTTAILIQLARTNYIAFYFSWVDTQNTGNFLYYSVSGIGAMALFGYEERWKGIIFSALSLILFYLSVFKVQEFWPASPHFFLILNFTVTYIMGFVIIYFLNELTFLTRQKETEKRNQLAKVNAELDRFVYSVSHDLRAPLSSILGLIQLLERTNDKKESTEYLNLMKGRIDRLEHFIRDIINFSRNARSELRTEKVNLKQIVDEIFETLKFINGAESIELRNELAPDHLLTTDRARLQIVLFNLISNAIQYRDVYKKSFIKVSSTPAYNYVKLDLDDNGIGIDKIHHDKVFNMFYRATDSSKGSGLGLYIVKETVEKLGGNISLQSIRGEGTRFTIELPL